MTFLLVSRLVNHQFARLTQPGRATVVAMYMQLVDKSAGGTRDCWAEELTTR